ncbi:MAG: heme exporter protein CcmD [Marinobacter sp.]
MAFDSLSAFIHMEGHGPYVWTCYGVFFLLMALIAWFSWRERRQVVRQQRHERVLASSGRMQGTKPSGGGSFQRIPSTQNESVSKS